MNNSHEEQPPHIDTPSKKIPLFGVIKQETFELIRFILIAGLIIIPFRIFIAQPFIVNGASMDPTFETSQYLIVDQVIYRNTAPRRGDVIVFRFPLNQKDFYIKRIIGLPGETVTISGSSVYIKKKGEDKSYKLDEPYLSFLSSNQITTQLSDDEYFVMGDNRPNSSDGRHWGPLKEDLIVGRAFIRVFPLKTFGIHPGAHTTQITNEIL